MEPGLSTFTTRTGNRAEAPGPKQETSGYKGRKTKIKFELCWICLFFLLFHCKNVGFMCAGQTEITYLPGLLVTRAQITKTFVVLLRKKETSRFTQKENRNGASNSFTSTKNLELHLEYFYSINLLNHCQEHATCMKILV